jgi:hypothetical protein
VRETWLRKYIGAAIIPVLPVIHVILVLPVVLFFRSFWLSGRSSYISQAIQVVNCFEKRNLKRKKCTEQFGAPHLFIEKTPLFVLSCAELESQQENYDGEKNK